MIEELQRRNYSQNTIDSYILAVKEFAEHFHKSPALLGAEEVRQYQLYLINDRKLAAQTIKVRISALRFIYWKVLKRRDLRFDDIPLPKRTKKLPTVLSPAEIVRLIEAASSLMHRTILILLYATGIRRAELRSLKLTDIDSQRMVIHIQQGKGRYAALTFIRGIYLINWSCVQAAGNRLFCRTKNGSGNNFQTLNCAHCQSAGPYPSYPNLLFQPTTGIEYP